MGQHSFSGNVEGAQKFLKNSHGFVVNPQVVFCNQRSVGNSFVTSQQTKMYSVSPSTINSGRHSTGREQLSALSMRIGSVTVNRIDRRDVKKVQWIDR